MNRLIILSLLVSSSLCASSDEAKQNSPHESPKRSPKVSAIIIPSAILSSTVKSPETASATPLFLSQKVTSATPNVCSPYEQYDQSVMDRYNERNASTRASRRNSSADATRTPSATLQMVKAEIEEFQLTPNIESNPNAVVHFIIAHRRARTLSQDIGERIREQEQAIAQEQAIKQAQQEQSQEQVVCGWSCFSRSKKK
ncbi:MAG: hypothetical protein P4L31_02860 [Candidatus Babeliales bacterium]|nr:hypothetical protein [Candidatus Babeliales bacterium]